MGKIAVEITILLQFRIHQSVFRMEEPAVAGSFPMKKLPRRIRQILCGS